MRTVLTTLLLLVAVEASAYAQGEIPGAKQLSESELRKIERRAKPYIKWQRHYEQKMGLEEGSIGFGRLDNGWCGVVSRSRKWGGTWTFYDPFSWRCRNAMGPRRIAVHEACHRRYAHEWRGEITLKEKHAEVDSCIRKYW